MNTQELIDLIRVSMGEETQKEFAERIGISPQYLNDVLKGKREPGEAILKPMGITKRVSYEKLAGQQFPKFTHMELPHETMIREMAVAGSGIHKEKGESVTREQGVTRGPLQPESTRAKPQRRLDVISENKGKVTRETTVDDSEEFRQ